MLFLAILLIGACSPSSGVLSVQDAWTRPARIGENGAAYFTIENGTANNDSLVSVSSDIAKAAELHMSMAHENGVMSMEMQEAINIPAGEQVKFEPGALHVMLVDVNQDLKTGDTITLTLNFQNAGNMSIDVSISHVSFSSGESMKKQIVPLFSLS